MTTQELRGKIKEDFAFWPGGGIDGDRGEASPQRAQSRRGQRAKLAQAYDSIGVALVGDPKGSGPAVVVWNDDDIARRARRAISLGLLCSARQGRYQDRAGVAHADWPRQLAL
jgi:hypothetical protein